MQTQAAELLEDGAKRDRRGRRWTPPAQRGALVRAFHASGLTQAAFARREGVSAKTLSHWLKVAARPSSVASSVPFVQVSVPGASATRPAALEVALADGTIVRGADAHAMAALVRALRG